MFAPIGGHWNAVHWYDAASSIWKEYRINGPHTLPNVDRMMGLSLDLSRDASGDLNKGVFTVVGKIPAATQIPLYWTGSNTYNMVGYPYLAAQHHAPFGPMTVAEALQGICWVKVETYDPLAPPGFTKEIFANDLVLPGLGYWVQVSCAGTWTLVNSLPAGTVI